MPPPPLRPRVVPQRTPHQARDTAFSSFIPGMRPETAYQFPDSGYGMNGSSSANPFQQPYAPNVPYPTFHVHGGDYYPYPDTYNPFYSNQHFGHYPEAMAGRNVNEGHLPFVPPEVLVLRQTRGLDTRNNFTEPRIISENKDLRVERQRIGQQEIWNAGQFMRTYNIQGKAVMGSLLMGNTTAGEELWKTLTVGNNLLIVYTRGSGMSLMCS